MASTPGVRKTHKIYHKTNPNSLPNPYNWELRIRLLDQAGEFIEMVSQIAAFRLLKGDAAELVLVKEPTIQLKVPTEEWRPFAKGAPQKHQAKWHNWLHARRTILYGNYHILSPEGHLMFHCNNQKALWYLNRDLVEIVAHDPPTLQLKFIPGGPGHVGDDYYLTPKINRCVVCGGTNGLNRHHVVPSCYRRYMGLDIKSHSYHDVLLLCLDCHESYEVEANRLKHEIGVEYNCPTHCIYDRQTGEMVLYDHDNGRAVQAAIALVRNGERIPEPRRQELMSHISSWLGREATHDDVLEISKRGHRHRKMEGCYDHGEYIVRQMKNLADVQKFIERWRHHFLAVMQPKYLPANWDVEKAILPEDYEPIGGSLSLHHERSREYEGPKRPYWRNPDGDGQTLPDGIL